MASTSKSKNPYVPYHASEGEQAYLQWLQENAPDAGDDRVQRLAAALLEHTAQLYRFTGDEEVLLGIRSLTPQNQRVLLLAGLRTIEVDHLLDALEAVGFEDEIEEADVPILEELLEHRDTLGQMMRLIEQTALPLLSEHFDRELAFDLGEARLRIESLDAAFQRMPHAMLGARTSIDGIRAAAVVPPAPEEWWLRDPWSELEEAEDRLLQTLEPATKTLSGEVFAGVTRYWRPLRLTLATAGVAALLLVGSYLLQDEQPAELPIQTMGTGTSFTVALITRSGEEVFKNGYPIPVLAPDEMLRLQIGLRKPGYYYVLRRSRGDVYTFLKRLEQLLGADPTQKVLPNRLEWYKASELAGSIYIIETLEPHPVLERHFSASASAPPSTEEIDEFLVNAPSQLRFDLAVRE